MTPILDETERTYLKFKVGSIREGFQSLCNFYLDVLAPGQSITPIIEEGELVGLTAGNYSFFLRSMLNSARMQTIATNLDTQFMVVMTDKYTSTGFEFINGEMHKKFSGIKPKNLREGFA